MTDFNQAFDRQLEAEERELLRRIGEEPDHVDQVLSLFSGRSGWVSAVLMAAQTVMFAGGLWTGWYFLQAADALSAVHWGLPSAVLLLMSLMLKLALWPAMHANRLLVAMKRLELLAVRARAEAI